MLTSGSMPVLPAICVVCGRRLRGTCWRLADGRVYCGDHDRRHRCATCGIPMPAGSSLPCSACRADAVLTMADLRPHKERLLAYAARAGLSLPAPTQVLLARPGQVFPPAAARGVGHVGTTTWTASPRRLRGPITIQIAGGLPGHVFRQILGHEYGHAVIAGAAAARLPLLVTEGFAECVAADFLRGVGDANAAVQLEALRTRVDPVYGDGYRLVAGAVARHGLLAVADALRRGQASRVLPR